jgi:hypothetical protein
MVFQDVRVKGGFGNIFLPWPVMPCQWKNTCVWSCRFLLWACCSTRFCHAYISYNYYAFSLMGRIVVKSLQLIRFFDLQKE